MTTVRRAAGALCLAGAAIAAACERPSSGQEGGRSASAGDSALRATPGYVVDSAIPPAEALRRFRVGLDSVSVLAGPVSREALVKRLFAALERRDVNAMRALAMSRAEYAWIVYPRSRNSHPPLYQPPDVAWLLMQSTSNTGLQRLVSRLGGGQARYAGHSCDEPSADGAARIYHNCWVRVSASGEYQNRRLFGAIVEVGGRFKFAGYDTDF